jgi:hypothetical protein
VDAAALALAAAVAVTPCPLGHVVAERPLLRPRPATFYAVDALNPDVVRRGPRWWMFFSGNRVHTPQGDWRTAAAVSASATGPFVPLTAPRPWFNGGTVVWRGRFWQAHERREGGAELASSADGVHWRIRGRLPAFGGASAHDLSLEAAPDRLVAYMLLRPPGNGLFGTLGRAEWRDGRWSRVATILTPSALPWEGLDLGEPAPFRAAGRHYLLYTGTAPGSARRSIGLAREVAPGRWVRCSRRPFISAGASWARAVAIDPSPVVAGRCLYVYYGGGSGTSIASDLGGAIGVRTYRLGGGRKTRC